jgi:hypothetical protein
MRAIFRRLRRIEAQLTPRANAASQRAAQLIWDRRRRRTLANSEPFNEPPPHMAATPTGGYLSVAETLRRRRQLNASGPASASK